MEVKNKSDFTFFLGTHIPSHTKKTNVPVFISRRTLCKRKSPLQTNGIWAVDSGGFSELNLYGRWTIDEEQYVEELKLFNRAEGLQWAAQMDWMCEPWILEKTGLTVQDHQRKTVRNFQKLRSMECPVHIIPVLQGWNVDEYVEHVFMFREVGFDLRNEPLVGIGSVCRRQGTAEIESIVKRIHEMGIDLHGFGVKSAGLGRYCKFLKSADSLAWSYGARYGNGRCSDTSHHHTSKNCANCLTYALEWRDKILKNMVVQ